MQTFPTLHDRLQFLYENEPNMWYHSLECPLNFPHIHDFAQFLTRTVVSPTSPDFNENCPLSNSDLAALSQQLQALLTLRRPDAWSSVPDVMDCIHRWLLPHCPHLQHAHIDERGYLETFLKRSGYNELENEESPDYTILDEDRRMKFRIRARTGWQIRASEPLAPVSCEKGAFWLKLIDIKFIKLCFGKKLSFFFICLLCNCFMLRIRLTRHLSGATKRNELSKWAYSVFSMSKLYLLRLTNELLWCAIFDYTS